jgi:hypothetical protein
MESVKSAVKQRVLIKRRCAVKSRVSSEEGHECGKGVHRES